MTANIPSPQAVSLRECPFCGGRAEIEQFGNTRSSTIYCCQECGCRLETGEEFNHGRSWNRRASPADGVVVLDEGLANEIAEILDEHSDADYHGLNNASQLAEKIRQHLIDRRAASPALAATSGGGSEWDVRLEHHVEWIKRAGEIGGAGWDDGKCPLIVSSLLHLAQDAIRALSAQPAPAGGGEAVGHSAKSRIEFAARDIGCRTDDLIQAIERHGFRDPSALPDDGLIGRLWGYGNDYTKGDEASEQRARDMQDAAGLLNALSPPSADADKLLIAREALEPFADAARGFLDATGDGWDDLGETPLTLGDLRRAAEALARLSTTEARG